jgi:hypothetical protein
MSGFLGSADIQAALAAIKGTTDTFMKQEVTFEIHTAKLAAFTDNRAKNSTITEKVVLGLFIQGQQVLDTAATGAADLGDGYVLCNREDLAAVGLANLAGELAVNPATDTVKIGGERYKLLTATPLGPLDGKYTLGKFITKKLLAANRP